MGRLQPCRCGLCFCLTPTGWSHRQMLLTHFVSVFLTTVGTKVPFIPILQMRSQSTAPPNYLLNVTQQKRSERGLISKQGPHPTPIPAVDGCCNVLPARQATHRRAKRRKGFSFVSSPFPPRGSLGGCSTFLMHKSLSLDKHCSDLE